MRCEKCEQEMETCTCGGCGGTVLLLGPFCYLCGRELSDRTGQDEAANKAQGTSGSRDDEIDLSTRILCSDGACIGVINDQGVCKVCGKPYEPET
jgi:hypothetical protein